MARSAESRGTTCRAYDEGPCPLRRAAERAPRRQPRPPGRGPAGGVCPRRPWCSWYATDRPRPPARVMPGRAPGLHLAETGRAQAERVAERIGALSPAPTAVYASPLERAQETAAPIARALGLRVRSHRGLLDCAVGSWEGKQLKSLAKTARVAHGRRLADRLPLPRRRVVRRDVAPRPRTRSCRSPTSTRASGSSASPTPTRSRSSWPRRRASPSTCSNAS